MDEEGSKKRAGFWDELVRFLSGRKRITEEEIHELMDAGEQEGLINEDENDMIRAIFTLRDTVVRDIMLPRTDMACIPVTATLREVLDAVIACGHSRIPVYDGTLDNIVGLVYAKDLLKQWGLDDAAFPLQRLIRTPYYIPETKNLEELLQEFKKKRIHIAIVIDEYGGTSGLVTIEDLLEQIVGDIQDEYDREEEWLSEDADHSVVVDGRLAIEELEEHFGIEIERNKFATVGGYLTHLTGRIPAVGEEMVSDRLILTILESDERRVSKVRIRKRPVQPDDGE